MTAESAVIRATRREVVKRWTLGILEMILERTRGADYEILALIRRVKTDQVEWHGPLPCRDWSKRRS